MKLHISFVKSRYLQNKALRLKWLKKGGLGIKNLKLQSKALRLKWSGDIHKNLRRTGVRLSE